MASQKPFIQGEFKRTLDERFRLTPGGREDTHGIVASTGSCQQTEEESETGAHLGDGIGQPVRSTIRPTMSMKGPW